MTGGWRRPQSLACYLHATLPASLPSLVLDTQVGITF